MTSDMFLKKPLSFLFIHCFSNLSPSMINTIINKRERWVRNTQKTFPPSAKHILLFLYFLTPPHPPHPTHHNTYPLLLETLLVQLMTNGVLYQGRSAYLCNSDKNVKYSRRSKVRWIQMGSVSHAARRKLDIISRYLVTSR